MSSFSKYKQSPERKEYARSVRRAIRASAKTQTKGTPREEAESTRAAEIAAARAILEAKRTSERESRSASAVPVRHGQRRAVAVAVTQVVRPCPKDPHQRNRRLLDMARGMPCLLLSPLCNRNPETTVACHGAGVENGKGKGYKVHDFLTVWGCSDCNYFTDQYGGATAAQKRSVFYAGLERQVIAWRQIATDATTKTLDRVAAQWALDGLAAFQSRGQQDV